MALKRTAADRLALLFLILLGATACQNATWTAGESVHEVDRRWYTLEIPHGREPGRPAPLLVVARRRPVRPDRFSLPALIRRQRARHRPGGPLVRPRRLERLAPHLRSVPPLRATS